MAARHLARRGFVVCARRLATRWAELDLLCREGDTLVVVEVKTGRSGARFRPGMRLRGDDLERLWRAARGLARGAPARVDLVEIGLEPGGLVVTHHRALREPL